MQNPIENDGKWEIKDESTFIVIQHQIPRKQIVVGKNNWGIEKVCQILLTNHHKGKNGLYFKIQVLWTQNSVD